MPRRVPMLGAQMAYDGNPGGLRVDIPRVVKPHQSSAITSSRARITSGASGLG